MMTLLMNVFGWLWRALDQTRRALLNLILLVLIGAALWLLIRPGPPALKDNTTLVLELGGQLVEQSSGGWRDRAQAVLQGSSMPQQLRLRDVLAVLDEAARDPKVGRVLLDVDELQSAGLASLREVAAAIVRVKAAGKPVIAWAEDYNQAQYFLAAHANEVYLHPMGHVEMQGFGRHRLYYKDLFDRFGIQAHVVRAGRYKSFAEPYSATGPSPETLEAEGALYGALWGVYTGDVERARKFDAGSIDAGIQRLPQAMTEAGGDIAKLAVTMKLVDGLKTADELREHLLKGGAAEDKSQEKKGRAPQVLRVSFGDYLARLKPKTDGDAIGVIVAEGNIVDGEAGPGRVGGRSTAALIRAAREDEKVKALVLRVRSPGGSAFASEQVLEELAATRKAGKPVIVSMGDVAASGGYWISQASDEVIADAATITGSIGVVGMLPTAEAALAKLGLKTGGVATTWLGDAYDPRRGLDPRFEKLIQQAIDHTYADFVAKTAAARKRTPEQIHEVAQGRVWSGAQAAEHKLVDRVGTWRDALAAARSRAKLPDDARLVYFERDAGRFERWMSRFVEVALPVVFGPEAGGAPGLPFTALTGEWSEAAVALRDLAGEGAAAMKPLAHCGCGYGR